MSTNSKNFYNYDAETVAERDGALRTGQMEDVTPRFHDAAVSGPRTIVVRCSKAAHAFRFYSARLVGHFHLFRSLPVIWTGSFAVVTINASLRSGKLGWGGMLGALAHHDSLQIGPITIPLALLDCLLTLAFIADVAMRYTFYPAGS